MLDIKIIRENPEKIKQNMKNRNMNLDKEIDKPFFCENPKTVEEFEYCEIWKLIINLIYYMNAFPECVFDGIPKGVRLENGFKNKKLQLDISDKIIAKTITSTDGKEIVPHFRVGHFTQISGEVIFIDSCFVKGKDVKTVIEKDDSYE